MQKDFSFSRLIKYKQCSYTGINFHRAIKQYVQQNLIIKYSCWSELAFIKWYVKSLWSMGVDKRFQGLKHVLIMYWQEHMINV